MEDESVKVQMFRFVDVLPMLKTHESVARHFQEYFDEVREHLPWAVRMGLDVSTPNSLLGKALSVNARTNARKMAERFIAGKSVEEVLQSVARLRKQGLAFTLDLLGEAVLSEQEAERYQQQYLDLINGLSPLVNAWPENTTLDRDDHGWIPRCNVSLKLSALYSQFKPIDPTGTSAAVKERLRPLLRAAREQDAYVHVDMEHYAYKDLTLQIFKEIYLEEEFRDWPDCGIVIQTYLPEAEEDLQDLLTWVKERGTPVWVRLVKGAYWDYETVVAEYRGWPCPVYTEKWQSDANFERQTRFLMQHHQWLRPAFASHNLRSLAHTMACAEVLDVPEQELGDPDAVRHGGGTATALYGVGSRRVRVYMPFGEAIPGMAYLVRRLLENTSNDSFLRHAYDTSVDVADLLQEPAGAPVGEPEA